MVRGAFGVFLRKCAPPETYARIFEPGRRLGPAPSGLAEWPRPFVLRAGQLDGMAVADQGFFSFDLHVFDPDPEALSCFRSAFAEWAESGIGPGRPRARLDRVESLDLTGSPSPAAPCSISLDPEPSPVDQVAVRFVSPTELKAGGRLVERPDFPVLFARIRDRVCTLRSLYGGGPLELDFRGMGERAAAVVLKRWDTAHHRLTRTSSRTGQTHPIGGFTGEVEYQGVLAEFVPWLGAARWTGVGRQTVWGKGEIHILRKSPADARNSLNPVN